MTNYFLFLLYQVTYLGKVSTTGMQFLSGCTEKPVIELWKKHTLAREDIFPANALLEIRPFQVWLHHLDLKGEATIHMDTFQVARIAYCTADHHVSPNIFAWIYREINDDLSYQMDCHAVECESKLEAKKLAHAMMEAFKKTFHSMKSDGRIHRNSSSEEMSQELESDDGWISIFWWLSNSKNGPGNINTHIYKMNEQPFNLGMMNFQNLTNHLFHFF